MRLMGLAYEMTLISLRLVDRGDIANNVVAQKLIELAKAGERDPERLCEAVLNQGEPPPFLGLKVLGPISHPFRTRIMPSVDRYWIARERHATPTLDSQLV
jgi:hypothetical protein